MTRTEALVDACHKRSRPILMTTIAMGAGMMPLALGLGADPSFRAPMAITVIGGLVTSTLLSLLVVPAVFTYVDDIEHWIARMVRKLRHKGPPPADHPHGEAANLPQAAEPGKAGGH
jgi:predicted RND superfamily exporter protein